MSKDVQAQEVTLLLVRTPRKGCLGLTAARSVRVPLSAVRNVLWAAKSTGKLGKYLNKVSLAIAWLRMALRQIQANL